MLRILQQIIRQIGITSTGNLLSLTNRRQCRQSKPSGLLCAWRWGLHILSPSSTRPHHNQNGYTRSRGGGSSISPTMFTVASQYAVGLIVVMQFLAAGALKCVCNPDDCEVVRSSDCPGRGITLWDPCKCVNILCALREAIYFIDFELLLIFGIFVGKMSTVLGCL